MILVKLSLNADFSIWGKMLKLPLFMPKTADDSPELDGYVGSERNAGKGCMAVSWAIPFEVGEWHTVTVCYHVLSA